MNELIPEFKKSLFQKIEDVGQEYLEFGIDAIFKRGIRELPIVKSIVAGVKTVYIIHERNMIKNLAIFINELNDGSVNEIKKKEYQYKINTDSKFAEKELSRILILLHQYIDNEKAVILAKFFKAHINEEISWEEFCEFSEVLNRIFIQDIYLLNKIYQGEIKEIKNTEDSFRIERLNSLGVVMLSIKSMFSYGNQKLTNSFVSISPLGEKIMKLNVGEIINMK